MKPKDIVSPTKTVGIWIRVSTEDQAKGDSPEHHEERARAYAKIKGWTIKEVYHLEGVSGKTVAEEAEAKRMLQDIRRGHIQGLIFSKLARLARNTRELLDFADHFNECNADLISLQESIDTSTPAGRLFYTMIAAMAQWEREEIADRVKASILIRARLGKPLNGTAPFAYHWQNKKLVVKPDEAPIRKLAYELFLQHRRKGAVARCLNDRGHRTRKGKRWSDMAVRRILECSSAKGVYRYNTGKKSGTWKSEGKPLEEQVDLPVEPIVTEALWNQCAQIMEEQLKAVKRPGKKPVHPFAGLTFCSCGSKMYVPSNTLKYTCKCRNKIPAIDLESIFIEELKSFFKPEKIARHLVTAKDTILEKERFLARQRGEIDSVREKMAKTHKLYLEGQIPMEGFGEFYNPLNEQLRQLQSQIPKLEAELDHQKINNLSADEVIGEAGTLQKAWPALDAEAKRRVVESLIEKIVIGKDNTIDITFSYLPSSEEMTKSQQHLMAGFAAAHG